MPPFVLATVISALVAAEPAGTMLERAARADALHRIYAQLATLPLVEGVPLAGWPGWTSEHEARLRERARAACTFANFQIDAEGQARVLATLPLAAVQIEEEGWPRLVGGTLVAIGRADPRVVGSDAPESWEHTTPQGRTLAELAAREILRQRLFEQVRQELLRRGSAFDAAEVRARIATVWELGPTEYQPTQLCRVTGRVSLERLGPGRATTRSGQVDGNAEAAPAGAVIEASAYAAAPWLGLWSAEGASAPQPPAWAGRRLRATGRGAGSSSAPEAVARESAEKAARLDALMKMAREIDRLPLAGDFPNVRGYLLAHPEDDDAWVAFLQSGRTVESTWQNGVSQVTIEWDLGTLWGLIEGE